MRATKYEQEKAAEERAKEIKANIADLEAQLNEAQHILGVIPTQGYEAEQDRREVCQHIVKLKTYLDDERKALSDLGVGNIDEIARIMGA